MPFTSPTQITVPFCSTGTPGTDYIVPPVTSIDPDIMTQEVGYPISQATAFNSGGVPVTRPQTNGALNLYSGHILWTNVGGQYTFNADVATAGGYNEGAVLFYFVNNRYVVSLIGSNTNDFVTTPSFIDGVNWQYLDVISASALRPFIATGSSGAVPFQAIYYPSQSLIVVTFTSTVSYTGTSIWTSSPAIVYTSVLTALGITGTILQAPNINNAIVSVTQSTTSKLLGFATSVSSSTISGATLNESISFDANADGTVVSTYIFNLFLQ